MPLTLFEASKRHSGDIFRQGVIETIGTYGSLLQYIPFMNINGAAYNYNVREALPGVAFRGVNESFSESTGVVNPKVETLNIFGSTIKVDSAIVKMNGEDQRDMEEEAQLKAMSLDWTRTFIKGDSSVNVKEFDGLQTRLTGPQVIDAGATANGDALSLTKLDELIDQVDSPTHLLMNRTMIRLLSAAARNPNIGGDIAYEMDDFGKRVTMYNGLPIIAIDEDASRNQILGFDEAAPGGGTNTACSIYCISVGDGQLMGIQNDDPRVEDLGLDDTGTMYRTVVEWFNSIVLLGDRSAARLRGIANAAVVV